MTPHVNLIPKSNTLKNIFPGGELATAKRLNVAKSTYNKWANGIAVPHIFYAFVLEEESGRRLKEIWPEAYALMCPIREIELGDEISFDDEIEYGDELL
jgi:hypothetical protein